MSHSPSGNEERLLTIKEAAARLRVSEVSLRRWTDDGALPCLRVGGRRERRFREADLLAFLAADRTASRRTEDAQDAIRLHGLRIPHGRHLCALYGSTRARDKLAIPFLVDGLERGDRCFLVASADIGADLCRTLAAYYPDVAAARASDALTLRLPASDPMTMLDYFADEFARTTLGHHRPMRVLGDMTSFITAGAPADRLFAFEQVFDRGLAHQYAVVSLCQYDVRLCSGLDVIAVLETHADTCDFPLRYFLGT